MRVIEAVAARLDQSVKMVANLGIELPSSDLSSETRSAKIWRCIFCRHGSECAEWVSARTPGVTDREFYLGCARDPA